VVALTIGVLIGACGGPRPADDGNGAGTQNDAAAADPCATPNTGCPCSSAGQSVKCGNVKETYGNFVTCAEGTRACTAGTWGPCVATTTTFQSVEQLGGSGITIQNLGVGGTTDAGNQACATAYDAGGNPCDPSCQTYIDNSTGVDGGTGLAATDAGGWTLIDGGVSDAATCTGFQCNIPVCTGGKQTTITGTVYDPAGLNYIYHAQVYIPAALPLPAIPVGAQKDVCGGGGNLPPSVAYALTGPNGQFTLTNVPASSTLTFPLVVQVGKWRRQFTYSLAGCQNNPLNMGNLLLPSTRSQGNLPHIGLVSGYTDSMECLMHRIGVASSEFCDPGAGCAVDFYEQNGMKLSGGSNPNISGLLGNSATMLGDDLIMLPCEGGSEYGPNTANGTLNPATGTSYKFPASYGTNIVNYTNVGGRLFTSHWGRQWIEGGDGWWTTVPYPGVASWIPWIWEGGDEPPNFVTGQINTSFVTGVDFSTWMTDVGGAAGGLFAISPWRVDTYNVSGSSQLWVSDQTQICGSWGCSVNLPADFTFNTPLNAATTYGRVMYTDMHLSYASSQCGDTNDGCTFPKDCTTGVLSGQEKAAEFLLFDLQGCTTPLPPPPVAVPTYPPATFTRDFQGTCPSGTRVAWHLFSYSALTPGNASGGSNVVFKGYTADSETQLPTEYPQAANLGTASGNGNPDTGATDVDTALLTAGVPASGQPPYASHSWLRVTMGLNPTPDQEVPPTLLGWNQAYDCVASE
jgi:hypothetical protein